MLPAHLHVCNINQGICLTSRKNLRRCTHAEGTVRSCAVIHTDGVVDTDACLFECKFTVVEEPAVLKGVVHPLGKCVVQRVARLRHAYAYSVLLQQTGIFRRGVLHAPVRVMYHAGDVYAAPGIRVKCHAHGRCRSFGVERPVKTVSDDVPAVGIGYEREVCEAFAGADISYVRNYQTAVICRNILR